MALRVRVHAHGGLVAPTEPGVFYVWLVVRDARGGTGFQSFALEATP